MACKHSSKKYLSLTGRLQSKIKILLLEIYGRGYLSDRLTKTFFRIFRLRGA